MEYVLSPSNREVLAQMAWSNVLLAFDFDGTLAPIVKDPTEARLPPLTRALLEDLAVRYPCAIISGRAREDVLKRLQRVRIMGVVGNHGLEASGRSQRYVEEVQLWRRQIERRLRDTEGVTIEDKVFSLAIHYRRSRRKRNALQAIARVIGALKGARVIRGKAVVNLVPEGAPHKGMALENLRTKFACDTAMYLGDDETDEDVFALDQPGRLLSIRVGRSRRSSASYYLKSQAEVPALLRVLLGLREARESRLRIES